MSNNNTFRGIDNTSTTFNNKIDQTTSTNPRPISNGIQTSYEFSTSGLFSPLISLRKICQFIRPRDPTNLRQNLETPLASEPNLARTPESQLIRN